MEHAISFTSSEFLRMQTQVTNLLKINKEMKAELLNWRPDITIESGAGNIPSVVITSKYGQDGKRIEISAVELASAPPEVLLEITKNIARQTSQIKDAAIVEMIRNDIQRAANYCSKVVKGN